MAGKRGRKPRKGRKGRRRSPRVGLWAVIVLAALAGALWLAWPFWQLSEQFGERPTRQPSRLYGRPQILEVGALASLPGVIRSLTDQGYRRVAGGEPRLGELVESQSGFSAQLRPRPTPAGRRPAARLEVRMRGGRVASLRLDGQEVAAASLEPPVLATYHGPEVAERRPVAQGEVTDNLIRAVLAAEDDRFFEHPGLSASGIARAAWVNLRGGELRQGGSTVTQQLVKNLFLTHRRTWGRKLREAILAVLIDLRYDKHAILNAYLNEIYWGTASSTNLIGAGAASWAYFGKLPAELDLCESALLAGMIRSPGGYSPASQPDRARERRDWVLRRMAELDWLAEEGLAAALAEPLCYSPHPVIKRRAPYFSDAVAAEARRRFATGDLGDAGYSLLSTLDAASQRQAEEAVGWGLQALEKGWESDSRHSGPLQAALVSLDPRSGEILSYVGGRDYGASQFDRAGRAQRQAGSAFKPVVYAAAFDAGAAVPSGFLEDAPLTVALAGRDWTPSNSDDSFRGRVTVRRALEESLNIPTVRLAMDVGLPRVVELARDLGIGGRLQPVPALALGAFEVTPIDLATAYATLAAGGLRPPAHGLRAVLDRNGAALEGEALPATARVLSAEAAYLVTSILQGVLDRGTGRGARRQGLADPLAGKTGTTNGRRDSWFAGYSPDRVSLVWVGYDDNSESRLSGARAALPIWARFSAAVRPAGGYAVFSPPPGIDTAVIDPLSGGLAIGACPQVLTEVFPRGAMPSEVCYLHGGRRDRWAMERRDEEREGRWRWLRKIFGRRKNRDR